METVNSARLRQSKNQNKESTLKIGSINLRDEKGIGGKIYDGIVILLEFLVMIIKMLFADIEALYRLIFPPEEKDVSKELVLVTGTGHGIGKELALQYSALGSTLVCVDINEKTNLETVKEIKNKGGKAHSFICNVSSREDVFKLAERVRAEVGEVSVLVNNAGVMPCHSFMTHREDEIKKMFDINVYAHFWMLQAFLPSMISRNHGHIVALSSMAGIVGTPNLVPYCGSKFAVRGIMEALYEELREDPRGLNIKFTSVYPYIVDTGLCHKPRIRFPSLMSMVKPKDAASTIITAMRREYMETSIPPNLLTLNNYCRLLPIKIAVLLKDFLDSGVESHE